jgi:hypothetical protein
VRIDTYAAVEAQQRDPAADDSGSANVVFTVATVWVVWFTNTSWQPDQSLAPYKVEYV